MPPRNTLYGFHYASQLTITETRSQRRTRLYFERQNRAEIGQHLRRRVTQTNVPQSIQESHPADLNPTEQLGFEENFLWEDIGDVMSQEDAESLACLRSFHEELIQQQRYKNWSDVMDALYPVYLHLKRVTQNWTLSNSFNNFSSVVCSCTQNKKTREVDLVDLMGQQRVKFEFCTCTPDPVHLLANGYVASTPVFPQTAFSVRLLNFYDLLWNLCNSHATPFVKVLQRWNESISIRLCGKNTIKPRVLRRNFVASVDVYRVLRNMRQKLVESVTSTTNQEQLAQRSCPACFGVALPVTNGTQPNDNNKVFICLDGNFQHRHHERASRNYVSLQNQRLFIPPEDIQLANTEIREGELSQRVSQKAKDRCTEQHKAADDRRNASSWKGCDDTGIFGCCCRHDAVISFSNIHKTGEGRGHPMAIIKRLFNEMNTDIKLGIVYDIGCTLEKFFKSRGLLREYLPRMTFATAVFHSYVHNWPCQLQFNPRYNVGWGLTDGEGLERLWSYLASLVSPLRYATRNHRLSAINHRSMFHNTVGIENIVLCLKRKIIHAVTTRSHSSKVVQQLLSQQNPHVPGNYFTEDFFRDQWEKQRKFEIDLNQKDREKKEEQAQFFERGEAMKTLAESFVSRLSDTTSQSDSTHTLMILDQIRNLQKQQDEEAEKLGSFFSVSSRGGPNREQEKRLGLLWSAKNALYKCAVQIQGETQPLRDSKSRGDRLGTVLKEKIFEALGRRKKKVTRILKTFCNRRSDYLRNHAPDQLTLPENQEICYADFTKLQLDDPFWNDGYMCMSKDPWSVDSTVRTGIHAILRLDRANEELQQLAFELRRCLSWGVHFRNQLRHRIDQCVLDTADEHLNSVLVSSFGQITYPTRKIVSDELQLVQNDHEKLLQTWEPEVSQIAALGVTFHAAVPVEWLALMEYLKISGNSGSSPLNDNLDLHLEDTELNGQDSDGESADADENAFVNEIEGIEDSADEDDGEPL
ncbi:hypothetical protein PCASD_23757 [Puccinia coronata f. sp. avenae]|uniref:CxC1-like cysteine cluster associated with KDZ transposases domain-containing protein n=1 Tax=Puccinia coronata f. sp. avenae TaxID=200324 RepID=A0A2N5RXX2_9BASI|nr:hypothetical protein PCASD_23757 [Puccinia coronata f. sp. avenae]